MTRVLYTQYTNPGAYPPLEHSAAILAAAGASVEVLGTTAVGTDSIGWAPRSGVNVSVRSVRQEGARQKVDYVGYALRVMHTAVRTRPHWLYVSDALAAPIAIAVRALTGVRIVYHEHDEPMTVAPTRFMRMVLAARLRVIRLAEEVVVPNAGRADRMSHVAPRRSPIHVVWNCPMLHDVGPSKAPVDGPLRIVYQGSINKVRLPLTIVEALSRVRNAELVVIGYETIGSQNYSAEFMHEARLLGVSDRVQFLGPMPRHKLLDITATCHVGLSLMPMRSDDANEANMAGASNKAFEYMARGLGLVVSDLPSWREMFAQPGFAQTCDPADAESVGAAIQWYAEHRAEARDLGHAAQKRILNLWNYEAQFAPVAQAILGLAGPDRLTAEDAA